MWSFPWNETAFIIHVNFNQYNRNKTRFCETYGSLEPGHTYQADDYITSNLNFFDTSPNKLNFWRLSYLH